VSNLKEAIVRIKKENFAKGYKQTFDQRYFQGYSARPQPVYVLSDFKVRPIEGQYYNYVLAKVTISTKR
jgi:hypothetical protein